MGLNYRCDLGEKGASFYSDGKSPGNTGRVKQGHIGEFNEETVDENRKSL